MKDKRLFLSSSFSDVATLLTSLGSDLKGKQVTFIPTASLVEEVTFYVELGKKALQEFGLIIDELEVSTATHEEIVHTLRKSEIIYVTGGNTFFLLQELKKSGADKIIREEVHAGKLYIGESAGSIVAAPDIEYVKGLDSVKKAPELSNFEGLGLVDFYPVPHYTNDPFKEAVEEIISDYGSQLFLYPITNKEAILVLDGLSIKVECK